MLSLDGGWLRETGNSGCIPISPTTLMTSNSLESGIAKLRGLPPESQVALIADVAVNPQGIGPIFIIVGTWV